MADRVEGQDRRVLAAEDEIGNKCDCPSAANDGWENAGIITPVA